MQVIYKPIDKLIPYVNNARTHSDEQVSLIAGSIKEFGFNNPVLLDGENGVIAGHGRLLAAKKLGLSEVPCIELSHLSDTQKKAYILADNQLALRADWNDDILKLELRNLKELDFDTSLLGFDDFEVDLVNEGLTDEDEIPEVPEEPETKLGDIYILGNHRLMCGDSTIIGEVEKLIDGNKADMIFTDPPWNVNYGAVNHPSWKARTILNDHMNDIDWNNFVSDVCKSLFIASKPGCPIYVVMSAQEWAVIDKWLRAAGFHWSSTIIWVKDTLVLSRKDYHTQYEPIWQGGDDVIVSEEDNYEPIFYGWNDNAKRLVPITNRKNTDVWKIERPKISELHPTTKPIALIEKALKNSSKLNNIILDLFGGSGSTLIACEKNNRQCRMMELDPKYCDVIVKRWEDFTGKKAVKIG